MAWETVAAFWGVSLLFVITPGADWAYAIAAGLRHRSVLPSVVGLLSGHLVATAVVAAGVAALLAGSPRVMTALTVAGSLYLVWMGLGALHGPVLSPVPASVPMPDLAGPDTTSKAAQHPTADTHRVPVLMRTRGPLPAAESTRGGTAAVGTDDTTVAAEAAHPGAPVLPTDVPWWRQVAAGAGVSGLNPKVFLLFLALLPQFTTVSTDTTDTTSSWPVAAQIVALGGVHVASCAVVYTAVGLGMRAVLRARPSAARVVTRVSGAAMVVVGVALLLERVLVHG